MENTLLLVDDEPAIRRLLKEYFKNDFNVIDFDGGQACLDWLGKHPAPAVAIVDMVMPDLSGLEVIRQMQYRGITRDCAVVVLSGKESSADRVAALRAGADDYLVKPFNPDELRARIEAVLRRIKR